MIPLIISSWMDIFLRKVSRKFGNNYLVSLSPVGYIDLNVFIYVQIRPNR